jgi:hypothetical protein
MQLQRLVHGTVGSAHPRPAPGDATGDDTRTRVDSSGRTFRQVLVDITPPRHVDDIDGDGEISDPERLVRTLRDLAEQLALEALLRPGKVDPVRLQQGMQLITKLAGALTERIEDREPITREDLADISMEAIEIYHWACAPADEHDDHVRPEDNPAIDGRITWRTERPGADLATLRVIEPGGGSDRPSIQRVTWVEGADARGALAARLAS